MFMVIESGAMSVQISLLYGGLLGLLFCLLSARVMFWRFQTLTVTGDGGDTRNRAMVRGHANFCEYVPIALALLVILELSGLSDIWLHVFGGTLFLARCLHAWGMWTTTDVTRGRRFGAGLTFVVLLTMAIACFTRLV